MRLFFLSEPIEETSAVYYLPLMSFQTALKDVYRAADNRRRTY